MMNAMNNSFRLCSLNSNKILFNSLKQNVPLQSQTAGVKSLEEKIGLPPKPKKPMTPYFRFMMQLRPQIKAENPNMHVNDIVRVISKKWSTAEESTKQKLQVEYQNDKMKYVELRAKYDSQITDEQKLEIKQLKSNISDLKERRAMKKRIQELGKPKKPASAFLRFLIQERTATPQKSTETYREWHNNVTARWARLPEEKKKVFLEAARRDIEVYKVETSKWEEKMVRMGNIDVVRSETLIDPPEPKSRQKSRSKSE